MTVVTGVTAVETTPDIGDYVPQIASALRYANGTHTAGDVVQMVNAGQLQPWFGPRSIIVTEIIATPRRKVLHFFLAGGVMAEIRAMTPHVLAWGKAQGCDAASLIGRKGWARSFLARNGWTVSEHLLMERDL